MSGSKRSAMAAWTHAFVLKARAKLNLSLSVGSTLPNGLHELRSLNASLTVADELLFEPHDACEFTVVCEGLDLDERENLAFRAGAALGVDSLGVRITISKRIPVEAGLGGGSADAAAALRGLARIARERGASELPESDIFRAASALGSDVPGCLVGGFKWIGGTGEIVRPENVAPPAWGVALLKPESSMSTTVAYRLFDEHVRTSRHVAVPADASDRSNVILAHIRSREYTEFCAAVHNDFDAIVRHAVPDVARAHERLAAAGANATLLCGSGTAVAGFFPTTAAAREAVSRVDVAGGEWAAAAEFADDR